MERRQLTRAHQLQRRRYGTAATASERRGRTGGRSDCRRRICGWAGVSRCFAVAELDPPLSAVTPAYLADVGRRLMLRGNAVAAMRVTSRGLTLLPAAGFDVSGSADPATWFYVLHLPGPTRREDVTVAEGGVVHHRVNADGAQPWIGQSPLVHAGLSATLVARLEARMGDEANSRVGYLLPHDELSDPQIQTLKNDLATMRGNVGLVRKQTASYDPRGQVGGSSDWSPRRFGAVLPETNVTARREARNGLGCGAGSSKRPIRRW